MRLHIFFLSLILFCISCESSNEQNLDLQQFTPVLVKEFKKKNVSISTLFRFYNNEEKEVNIAYAEFDIIVNGKDLGTFIQKKSKNVPANGLFELPIELDFTPEDAFLNLDYGIVKIKSDIVSKVALRGYLTVTSECYWFRQSTSHRITHKNSC
jgi:hypothetical protein